MEKEKEYEKELQELLELLETRQYTKLRQYLATQNEADIALIMEELDHQDMLKTFRILPKDLAGGRLFLSGRGQPTYDHHISFR